MTAIPPAWHSQHNSASVASFVCADAFLEHNSGYHSCVHVTKHVAVHVMCRLADREAHMALLEPVLQQHCAASLPAHQCHHD